MNAYFAALEERVASEAKMAGFSEHDPDKGSNREQILIDILNDHLPASLRAISGGTIFNLDGKTSGQIDIIVKNNTFPLFGSLAKPMVPVEAVIGVIEVKSMLDTPRLKQSIDLLAEIPMWDDRTVASSSINRRMFPNGEELDAKAAYKQNWPSRMIYAYRGNDTDTLYNAAKNYYNKFANKDFLPMMIAVNKATNIRFLNKGGSIQTAENSSNAPTRYMHPLLLTPQTQGYSLAGMITHLSSWIGQQSDVIFKFSPYIDAMANIAVAELETAKQSSSD